MPAHDAAPWLDSYEPTCSFDEMLDPNRAMRPAWKSLLDRLGTVDGDTLNRRAEQARGLLREGGVTYGVQDNSLGSEREWELDPIPLVYQADEWSHLASGLAQRARLLDFIAADLYGPQNLLKQRVLPPEIVFANPAFQVACHGINPAQNVFVNLCGIHLGRDAQGAWNVLADRTQGPSGMGYCLENRIVSSRVMAADFHGLQVERLAGFFSQFREMLWSLAPRPIDDPLVVLLSPGPRSLTYFEDAYLARYMGFTLVEGDDLTVRGSDVFLKTLGGLKQVDVIWRRLADEDSDPLELQSTSWLGVAGLLQAVRSGGVSVANTIGTGWLESPALMAFLPRVCQFMLSEDLKIPSVPTWWCGEPSSLQEVESRFEECLVRPANVARDAMPIRVADLTQTQRAELLTKIKTEPDRFVAQTHLPRGTAPVWSDGRLEPWHVGLRAFVTATANGHLVMPGGLTRLAANQLSESTSAGQASKDVWVMSDQPVVPFTLLGGPSSGAELKRTGNDVPSRVIENIYWLSRFVERSEHIARQIRSVVTRISLESETDQQPELRRLVANLGPLTGDQNPDDLPSELSSGTSLVSECSRFIYDATVTGSLAETIHSARRSANGVRDRISLDSWRIINQLIPLPTIGQGTVSSSDLLWTLHQTMNPLLALGGLANENLTRGPVWRFWEMGRRLERASNMIKLVRSLLISPGDDASTSLELLLEIGDSSMTYRQRYFSLLQTARVLDLLVLDDSNPRSVAFQVRTLSKLVAKVEDESQRTRAQHEQRLLIDAARTVRLADADGLATMDENGKCEGLNRFLASIQHGIREIDEYLNSTYFAHTKRFQILDR